MSKAVMTIHGYLTDTGDFGRLYNYFGRYDEVRAVEIPGHNGNVDMRKFTVTATLKAVLEAYDKLARKHDQVDVVGFSMGGALTSFLCAERRVHRAVMLSPANKYLNPMLFVDAVKFYGNKTVQTYRSAEGNLREKNNAVQNVLAPYGENAATTGKIALKRTLRYFSPRNGIAFCDIVKICNTMVEVASPISTPVLVLWGKLDELVPYRSVEYVAEHFVNASVKVYPDLGHAMLYTNKDDVIIADVMNFLTEGGFDANVPSRDKGASDGNN